MNITGLITEYNPFHQGHQYHLDTAKSMTGADAIVVIMSGNFVQRGLPAMVDKYRRTRMALLAGADVVLELPVFYATGSAERFAHGAVSILDQLHCITDLVYGCECPNPALLQKIAALTVEEPPEYKTILHMALQNGSSFPAARNLAVQTLLADAQDVLKQPNNILAVEYRKALLRLSSPIVPHELARKGEGYHQSASVIRKAVAAGDEEVLRSQLPDFALGLLDYSMDADDFTALLFYRLRTLTVEEMLTHADVTPELAARILRYRSQYQSFSQFVDLIKTRQVTRTHIQRALLHLLLHVQKEESPLPFVRLLGFRQETEVLHEIKKRSSLPLLAKVADDRDDRLAADHLAADIFSQMVWSKYRIALPDEFHAGPILL